MRARKAWPKPSIDYARQDQLVIKMEEGAAGKAGPAPGLSFAKPEVTPGEPLRLEILSFLDAVRCRHAPQVTAQQGHRALALALEIQASMAAHAERAGLANFFNPGA